MRHAGFRGTGRDREGWCGQLCVEHDVRTTSECKQEERGHPGLKGRRGVAPNTGGIESGGIESGGRILPCELGLLDGVRNPKFAGILE